jgi:hypothetical protein
MTTPGKDNYSKRRPGNRGEGLFARAFVRLLLIFCGVLVALPMVAVLLLYSPSVQHRIIQYVVERIESDTEVKVQFEEVHWRPFSRIELTNLSVVHWGKELFRCEQSDLSYRLSLQPPYFHPLTVLLRKPALTLEKDKEGRWKLPGGQSGKETKSPAPTLPLSLQLPATSVQVESGSLVVRQEGRHDPVVNVQNLNGELLFLLKSVLGAPNVKVDLQTLNGEVQNPNLGYCQLAGSVHWQSPELFLDRFEAQLADKTHLMAHGTLAFQAPQGSNLDIWLAPFEGASLAALHHGFSYLKSVTGSLHVTGRDDHWVLHHQLVSETGQLDGTLTLNAGPVREAAIEWTARFADLGLTVPGRFEDARLTGRLRLAFKGLEPQSMEGRVECDLEKSHWGKEIIEGGSIRALYANGEFRLQSADIESSLGRLRGSGVFDVNGLWNSGHGGKAEAKLELSGADLRKVLPGEPNLQPMLVLVDVRGNYGAGQLENWQRWSGKAELEVRAPGLLMFKSSAKYDKETINLDYALDARSLEMFARFLPQWVGQGQMESKGSFQGKWSDLIWDGKVTLKKFSYRQFQCENCVITGHGDIRGKKAQRQISVIATGLRTGDVVTGRLRVDAEQKENGCNFRIDGERIANSASLQLTGAIQDLWNLPSRLRIESGLFNWKNQTWTLAAQVMLGREEVAVESIKAQQGNQEVRVLGNISWKDHSNLQLTWENLQLSRLLALFGSPQTASGISAGLSAGQLQMTGPLNQPRLTLESRVRNAKLHQEEVELVEFKGSYASRQINFSGRLQSSRMQTPVALSGQFPVLISLRPWRCELLRQEPMASTVQVVGLEMASLLPILPFLQKLSGRVSMEAKISATPAKPEIYAVGSWQDGALQLKDWPHAAEKIRAEWIADSQQLWMKTIEMDILGGRAYASGQIRYGPGQFRELLLDANVQDITVPDLWGITGKGSGQLQFKQSDKEPRLTGTFYFSKAQLDLGELEADLARDIEVIEGETQGPVLEVSSKQRGDGYYERMEMDLRLVPPASGTWVRGKGLEAEIVGELSLKKDSLGPLRLVGRFRSTRGTYTFQGNQLQIVEAEVIFTGVPDAPPHLQVLGQKDVHDVSIQVRVTGPANQPKLVLSSIPAMDQVDILSYLFFGRSTANLTTKEVAGVQEKAVFFIGSEASRTLKKALGSTPFAPDVLQLQSTANGGGRLEVGKYITPNIFLTYRKALSSENADQIQLEYRLNRHFSIQSQFGLNQQRSVQSQLAQEEQSSVDLLWSYNFGE